MTHFTWHLAYTLACICTTEHLAMLTQTKCSVNLIVFLHVCMHIIWPIKVHNLTQERTKQCWWDWGKVFERYRPRTRIFINHLLVSRPKKNHFTSLHLSYSPVRWEEYHAFLQACKD